MCHSFLFLCMYVCMYVCVLCHYTLKYTYRYAYFLTGDKKPLVREYQNNHKASSTSMIVVV